MYAIQHRCMSLKVDISRRKLLYVTFEFVLLRITIIYLTKHRCIHVRNFVRKKPPYMALIFQLNNLWYLTAIGPSSSSVVQYFIDCDNPLVKVALKRTVWLNCRPVRGSCGYGTIGACGEARGFNAGFVFPTHHPPVSHCDRCRIAKFIPNLIAVRQ